MGRDLLFLLIGPLQLEVTWYKIQNIEELKAKTKHNYQEKCECSLFHFPVKSCHILLLSNIFDFVSCELQL